MKNANRRYYRIADVVVRVESDLPITDGTFMPRFRLFETDGPGDDTITIRHHSVDSPMTPREFGLRVYRQPPWAVYDDGRSWMESGTLDTPIEHYCRTSHRIARGLGLLGDAENAWDIPNWEKRIEEFVKRGGRNGPQG